jgi:uncharacterized membrane protein YdjX (TVP38/TMEM64 family)
MKLKKYFILIVGIFMELIGVAIMSKSFATDSSPEAGIVIILAGLTFCLIGIIQLKGKTEEQKE